MLNKLRQIKRYKTCERCKAMLRGWCGDSDNCELGYNLDMRRGAFGLSIGYPGEPCPKPTTYKELLDSPGKWELPPKNWQGRTVRKMLDQ